MNTKKVRKKMCSVCEQTKPATDYQKHTSYCNTCKKESESKLFVRDKNNIAVGIFSEKEVHLLIANGLLELSHGKYTVIDMLRFRAVKFDLHTLSIPSTIVLAIGKYNEKCRAISKEKAARLVFEGAAIYENEQHIRHLFSGKELEHFVVSRDGGICSLCGNPGDKILFIEPRSERGLLSPQNSYCVCKPCKDSHGENMYFFRWVNANVNFDSERDRSVVMYDKRKQNGFSISYDTACRLVHEEMADWANENQNSISIRFDRKEFSEFILNRDHHTCHYCGGAGNTIDHVHPQEKGGLSTPKNCVASCYPCNQKKGNKI